MSSASAIPKFRNFDFNDLKLTVAPKGGNGQSIYINHPNGGPLQVSLPVMSAPFGAKKWDNGSYVMLDLSFGKIDDVVDGVPTKLATSQRETIEACRRFDEFVVNAVFERIDQLQLPPRNGPWTKERIRANLTSMLRLGQLDENGEPKYKPMIRTRMELIAPDRGGDGHMFLGNRAMVKKEKKPIDQELIVRDFHNQPIELNAKTLALLPRHSEVVAVIEPRHIFINGKGEITCTWRLTQLLVNKETKAMYAPKLLSLADADCDVDEMIPIESDD
ncbi:hypothetical protein HDU93_003460 [Gonapodya sp. JEL0774]|nr:hypothetical protein HDU93_003460 [Gonapodya sp. JEL0774]